MGVRTGDPVWVKHFGLATDDGNLGHFVAVDEWNNIFVAGYLSSRISPDAPVCLTCPKGLAFFFAKLDRNGRFLWHRRMKGESARVERPAIAVNRSGQSVLAATTLDKVEFETRTFEGSYNPRIVVIGLDAVGQVRWETATRPGIENAPPCAAIDTQGEVVLGRVAECTLGEDKGRRRSGQRICVEVVRFDRNGKEKWRKTVDGTDNTDGCLLTVSDDGSVFVANGSTFDSRVPPMIGSIAHRALENAWDEAVKGKNVFRPLSLEGLGDRTPEKIDSTCITMRWRLARIGRDGEVVWDKAIDDRKNLRIWSLKSDADMNVVLAGGRFEDVWIGWKQLGRKNSEILLSKVGADGERRWERHCKNDSRMAQGTAVAIDRNGGVVVAGQFAADFGSRDVGCFPDAVMVDYSDLGPRTSFWNRASRPDYGVMMIKYDSQGTYLWHTRVRGQTLGWHGADVSVDTAGDVVATGAFNGSISFGGSEYVEASGLSDFFLVKYRGEN
ncbi:MAG: hypothetical protein HY897_21440 [Deltaproteobacteria bacterium]|nr:hypothetical protein [Deltaproteobacteria bacterium]